MKGTCKECLRVVGKDQRAVYEVRGFEKERDSGGQNHVLRKERVDGVIYHEACYEAMARRLDGRGVQGSLL